MVEMTDIAGIPGQTSDAKVIGLVSGAHFMSHVYMLVLPPLFALVMADYPVGYEGLAFALASFNVVSAVFQTPAGFLVDRLGAWRLLVGGLVLSACGVALAGFIPFYWALIGGFALMGLANTIYHPADYSILSHAIGSGRLAHAFSIHTFFGTLGTAAAPVSMLFMASLWGWRAAFVGSAAFGFAMAIVLLLNKQALSDGTDRARIAAKKALAQFPASAPDVGWRLLLSPPILRNVAFFLVLSMASGGIQGFSIVALGALYNTPLALANVALSAYLLLNALGVLAGGFVASRAKRHNLVAGGGFVASGMLILIVGIFNLAAVPLVLLMALSGFLNGIIQPSRDMIVRAATPKGSFGKVFGFVSTGFNIAGIAAPLLFGWLMDNAHPRSIFLLVAAFTLLSLPLLTGKGTSMKNKVEVKPAK
jgi:MFS family permease